MKVVYSYDNATLEYIGPQNISPTVTDNGEAVYLIPPNVTEVKPLDPKEEYTICYSASYNTWEYVEDHRGEKVWKKQDLSEVIVDWLGPISDEYLLEKPEPENIFQKWNGEEFVYIDINLIKQEVKNKLDSKYNQALIKPCPCGEYFVLPEWANIYTNTLVAMQQDMDEDGKLDETYLVLLLKNLEQQLFVQIQMNSINDFLPYYNKVKQLYKDLSTEYHNTIVKISLADTPEKLIKIYNNI